MARFISKINSLSLVIISIIGLTLLFFHLVTTSIEVNESKFDSYYSIPEDSGVMTWLPDFFPKEAKNIHLYSNIDLNKFGVEFHLYGTANGEFSKKLTNKSSLRGITLIKKENSLVEDAWCFLEEKSKVLYLIGMYKVEGTYFIMNATHYRGFEKNYHTKIKEDYNKLCFQESIKH